MVPVIISGGSGVRLWPVSRSTFPKQFCDFLDESLFVKTLKRVEPLGSPWTITVSALKVLTDRAYGELDMIKEQVLYEPTGKNTAAAIAYLCRVFEMKGKAADVLGVFPADQLVDDDLAFCRAVKTASELAEKGHIVTLGVKPTYPATGYGYIETAGPLPGAANGALEAIGFREKPDVKTAEEFLGRGGFYWNAGMFIFKVSVMIEKLKAFAPDVWTVMSTLKEDLSNISAVYGQIRAISIDYAVMERLPSHVCIPCDFNWSDLGSWDAIAEMNTGHTSPHAVEVAGQGNFVYPYGGKTYALAGVSDLIVIDSDDALLILPKGQSERVKEIVEALKAKGHPCATRHTFDVRPWGRFDVLADREDFKSKIITVDSGAQISYQSHDKRAEHWIIVSGHGEVVLDEKVVSVSGGQHVFIPLKAKHRIRNTGSEPLKFVEVQLGSYFGEDDIKRYEDDYNRS